MFRLMVALGVATLLLPTETITQNEEKAPVEVSALDTFGAAQSVLNDVMTFCERNEETCITGKALATKAAHGLKSTIGQVVQPQSAQPETAASTDAISTGSIKN